MYEMNTTQYVLEAVDLKRHFGPVKAVDGISLKLKRGSVVGLIGANGAGKTTLLRLLTTLDAPDNGNILINHVDALAYPEIVRPNIGWMPDDFVPYKNVTVYDYIDFFARAYGLSGEERINEVERVMIFVGIETLKGRYINALSKGQTQRISLARTLIGNPDILFLDEPAAGLDPKARVEFKVLVERLAEEGKTLLISSHILNELAEMCDEIIMIHQGNITHAGKLDDVFHLSDGGVKVAIACLNDINGLKTWLDQRDAWKNIQLNKNMVEAVFIGAGEENLAMELREMSSQFLISEFRHQNFNLEEAFISLTSQPLNN